MSRSRGSRSINSELTTKGNEQKGSPSARKSLKRDARRARRRSILKTSKDEI